MNKLLFTLVLSVFSQFALSQNKNNPTLWRLTILDSATSKGIERATVSCINVNNFFTDINGVVTIDKSILNQDSIRISSIGYKTLLFKPNLNRKYPDTIRLSATITVLKEVRINFNSKKIVLGNAKESYKGGYLSGPNEEIAEYIPNNGKITGTIISVEYAINNGKKGIEKPFKVNLYSKRKNSIYPADELIKDSIIVYNPKRLPIVSVDISRYDIQIPKDGFFVGFETLSPSWYGNDSVKILGNKYLSVPGIKGYFKNGDYVYDETDRKDIKYSLHRHTEKDINSWTPYEIGTDFAIGAIVMPNQN